jgi:hypothetical protein
MKVARGRSTGEHNPPEGPRPSVVREYGLRIITPMDGFVVELFTRTKQGFRSVTSWNYSDNLISESDLQDLITSFTKTFVDDLIITEGVQLVLPL